MILVDTFEPIDRFAAVSIASKVSVSVPPDWVRPV
jgi:hypothetical protein